MLIASVVENNPNKSNANCLCGRLPHRGPEQHPCDNKDLPGERGSQDRREALVEETDRQLVELLMQVLVSSC